MIAASSSSYTRYVVEVSYEGADPRNNWGAVGRADVDDDLVVHT